MVKLPEHSILPMRIATKAHQKLPQRSSCPHLLTFEVSNSQIRGTNKNLGPISKLKTKKQKHCLTTPI